MKKTIVVLLFALISVGLVFSQAVTETTSEIKTQTFTDDLGRQVVLPENITKIAPSGSNAQVIVFQVASDKLAGLSDKLSGMEKEAALEALQAAGGKPALVSDRALWQTLQRWREGKF